MISEINFPDLKLETEDRATGFLIAMRVSGQIKPFDDNVLHTMIVSFSRLIDGVLLDYQAARESYYRLHTDRNIGKTIPVSAALVPLFHHIENCVSNMERVREMIEAIRKRTKVNGLAKLIDRNDWNYAETFTCKFSAIRNSVQHNHKHLIEGKSAQDSIRLDDEGILNFGNAALSLGDLANCLRAYRRISKKMIQEICIDK